MLVLPSALINAHGPQLPRIGDAVPDEIIAAMPHPQVVVQPGDRVADDLLPLGQEEGEVRENACARLIGKIGFLRRAPPDVIAGIDRLHLRRNVLAHARPDAVAAAEEIGAFAFAADEVHEHTGAVLLDALERVAEMVIPLIDGPAHEPLQPIPGGEDLRQMLFRNHASVSIEGDPFFDLDAEVAGPGAALIQRLQQFRMRGDPGAAADKLHQRALIDLGAPTDLPQELRAEKARHRAADDDCAPGPAIYAHLRMRSAAQLSPCSTPAKAHGNPSLSLQTLPPAGPIRNPPSQTA